MRAMDLLRLDRDDKTYEGYYTVVRGIVIVAFRNLTKSTVLGASSPLSIAERVLGELVDAYLGTGNKG
jgi:hypothetical protein